MKVLYIITSMDPVKGGVCEAIRNTIPEMEKIGTHNEVVCLDAPNAAFIDKESFKIHALGQAKGPWSYHEALVPWLVDNMHNFDVIFIHGLWQFHSYAAYKALKKYKKSGSGNVPKMYVMPHGMLDPYFQKAAGRKLKAIRNWLYWKLVEGKMVNTADGVLFTCQQELELARTTFSPYKPKKELNVSFGIKAPPDFKPEMSKAFALSCPDVVGKNYLLFLSRVHEKKGVDLLINAYLKLKKEYSNVPDLVIAGPGLDTAYGKRMLELARDNAFIHFPGMVTGDSKWGAFYGCDAFILPSHQENFGIAVAEALACYKPVLISNQINIWNEIANAQAGIVENDTDEGAYSLLLNWINTDEREKAELRKNARDVYTGKFKADAAAMQLYNALNLK
jgi:glycosyltransferase involved in cell wall biosynthesis